jgi:zinc protease
VRHTLRVGSCYRHLVKLVSACCLLALVAGCQGVRAPQGASAKPAAALRGATPETSGRKTPVNFRLENGLNVVLDENHAAPVVAFQAWVRVGSADEPPELAGIAHVFEHMLFKGTKKRGVGQIAQEVESAGGEINAWTSYDETTYHLVLASDFFDTGLDILADTLQNAAFDPNELERERQVVLEEIKQGLDDPDRMAAQGLFQTAFAVHPYGRPIIGSAETVRRLGRDDLVAFFKKHYVASNVTLVVVGDFSSERARRKIAAAFGGMPPGSPAPARTAQPVQKAPLVRAVARDVKEAQVLLGFRAPAVGHEDIPALDLLAVVLGQGESSRLNLEVVRNRQLVTSASAYTFAARNPGLFVIGASLPPGRVDDAARALVDEALRLAREEVSPEELGKSRNMLESDRIFDRETVQGYARKLGFFASIADDLAFETRYFDRLARLTVADLRRVAERYLRVSTMSLFVQIPESRSERRADRAEKAVGRLRKVVAGAEARADRRYARPQTTPVVDEVVRHVFPSGMTVLILRDTSVPIVAVRATWVGGLRYEDAQTNGISNLTAALLTRGTKTRSAEDIMKTVEGMAGSLSGYSGRNSLGLQAEFLSRHWERGLDLVADCLLHPTFSDEEIEKERRIVLDDLRAQQDNLGHVAFQAFQRTLWTTHPYRLDPLGTAASVSGFSRRKLLSFFRQHYGPGNLTLAIVGDVDTQSVLRRLGILFRDAGAKSSPAAAPPAEKPLQEPQQTFKFLAREQAHMVVGFPGITLDSPDRFALEILAQVLSGQGGRLFVEIREKRALAYRVSAFSMEGIDPGYFAVYIATSPHQLEEALDGVRSELRRVAKEGVTLQELRRAQRYLIGTHAIGLQRKSAIAAALAFHEAYGQGWRTYRKYAEHISQVKAVDVQSVARKYLDPGREVLAVVKPGESTPAARAAEAGARGKGRGQTQ